MGLDITYSYSDKLKNMLEMHKALEIKYIETYCIDQDNNQVDSIFSSKEYAAEYLSKNKPNDDLRLHKHVMNDAMFNDILPKLEDPKSTHNLLITIHKLSIKNILYFYFTHNGKILIISFAVMQNNLFIAQKYIKFVNFANTINQQYSNIINLIDTHIAQYTLHNIKPNYLSDQQKIILKYIVSGLMNKEISKITGLSTRTVEKHVSNICKRLNVKNRNQLISRYHFYASSTQICHG